MSIDLSGRVAIVTGAGGGLGRAHALLLARRGARVMVNDVGGTVAGGGGSPAAAQAVADEIIAAGGEAMASGASVTQFEQVEAMAAEALAAWGRIDILVNNAGILRDKTFAKMDMADFRSVMDVHVMGAVHCTKAVWETMRTQSYGRVVMTTSSSGLYGNFGQSNYGAAKMALVGLMQTLALEGARNDIRVNCLAPTAATRMLEGLMPAAMLERLRPELVSPGLLHLVSETAPTRAILCAGGGSFETAYVTLTRGVHLGEGDEVAEQVQGRWDEIADREGETVPASGEAQGRLELAKGGLDIGQGTA
jgi:NAD(P)-dependent dehydrogenase (short-subunit alcohol dehydrogenase family)